MPDTPETVTVNSREYAWPKQPVVVVCIDGSEPDYIERAVADGAMPFLSEALKTGSDLRADCVVPSFTNPNNISIVTGVPPSVHGIGANFFFDRDSGEDVMMGNPKFMRAGTIYKAFFDAGAKVAIITAKDKLTPLLRHGLDFSTGRAICFSSEKSDQATKADNGIDHANRYVGLPVPEVYSADLSEFIFAAGVKLIGEERADLMYLSTTDYVQHKNAPGSGGANDFYAMMDGYFHKLDALGAVLVLTADHGMKAKHNFQGRPNIVYLAPLLSSRLGQHEARIVLPITDPYVVHHGALGGFATIYLDDPGISEKLLEILSATPGIELALNRHEACRRFQLPPDRLGDIVVIASNHWVLGHSEDYHDLAALKEPLRSHGGLSEQRVPFIVSRPVSGLSLERLRNYDIFDAVLNHTC